MIYTPQNVQQKTSPKGTNYIVCDLMDMNGQLTENVSTFDAIVEGKSVDGQISQNGKYTNFKVTPQFQKGGKQGQIEKTMEKKQESINNSMDRKEQAIAHAGSITNATNLVTSMIEARIWANTSEEMVKNKVREYIVWYKELYNNPEAVAPF